MPRYFVKLPAGEIATEAMFMFLDRPAAARPYRSKTSATVMIADLADDEVLALQNMEAILHEDVRFEVFPGAQGEREYWTKKQSVEILADSLSLKDVLEHVQAPAAWNLTRGGGVTIAVVDTGICGTLAEFPPAKRSPIDLPSAFHGNHWRDVKGHGSMCATIAGATRTAGGRFDGIAPDATILAARTTLFATDIYTIYDELIAARRAGTLEGPLVISNSYGLYTCQAPTTLPEDHPYLDIVLTALDEGIPVVFAAGNNHWDVLCNHPPTACEPSTIWAVNSHERVISVGTVNRDNSNQDPSTPHPNSSRGPGQWSGDLPKPDCAAPTYGTVVWGCGYRQMDWWGTSGACPQVAGLAALLLSVNPTLKPRQVGDIIRSSCRDIGAPHNCVGHGLIDCAQAVTLAAGS
jgi:serine protease AprX